jgi:hypothetical protein
MTFVSASASQGSCFLSNSTVFCQFGSLAYASAANATIKAVLNLPGLMSNQFNVTHDLPEANAANNSVTVSTTANPSPAVSISDAAVLEGAGRKSASFKLALSAPSTLPVWVNYSTVDGTAVAGVDYDATSGVILFPAGTTAQTLTLSPGIYGNSTVQSNRSFHVNLSNPTNTTLARSQAVGTIIEDDFFRVSVQSTNVVEGNSSRTNALLILTLSPAGSSSVTVSYETLDGTATSGLDFLPRSGSLRFVPGATNISMSVPVLGDVQHDLDESFFLLLSGAEGAMLSVNEATARILNDDVEPVLALLRLERLGDAWRVRFSSAAGKSYRLQRSETLSSGSWATVTDQIIGTGQTIEVIDSSAPALQGFYRVQVLP